MLAENNPYIDEAAQTLYEANADETTKMKCRARRDYYKQKNTTEKMLRELTENNVKLTEDNVKLTEEILSLNNYIKELEEKLAKQNNE